MLVTERYTLPEEFKKELRSRPVRWGFGTLSEAVFYRTYSRTKDDGTNETWADVVVRVVEGVMSIRKDWYKQTLGKRWPEKDMTVLARRLAEAIYDMRFVPPGRGLWAMGSDYVYERGSMALNNCAFVSVQGNLAEAGSWLFDALMMGVGVGFDTHNYRGKAHPLLPGGRPYVIPDSREGWVESTRRLIAAIEKGSSDPAFDYSKIRPYGSPIKGFGGTASGPDPLIKLHDRIRAFGKRFVVDQNSTLFVADVMNAIGACVVSGNVRRSAQIALGEPNDWSFTSLKDYTRHPERSEWGWMSNNSVILNDEASFEGLPVIADYIRVNGEPGVFNMKMTQKYGRTGERMDDPAIGLNPCAEIPLESHELCNLVEVFPTRHPDAGSFYETLELATFYASTVALLRSHSEETNEVVARNRRIGVSVSGIADWVDQTSVSHVFASLNHGYDIVRVTNAKLAKAAGVPESIRVTTVKPSGTVSLLAGVSAGVHWPTAPYVVRRIRIGEGDPVGDVLKKAGVPFEQDVYSDHTEVFEFPLAYGGGRTRSIKDVSIWEQASLVSLAQRSWADNAVSNTLTFHNGEAEEVEAVLSYFAPQVKSLSMLPDREGVYEQMPLEAIDKHDYDERRATIDRLDFRGIEVAGSDKEVFCTDDKCEVL